jgi:hypothetical protein
VDDAGVLLTAGGLLAELVNHIARYGVGVPNV